MSTFEEAVLISNDRWFDSLPDDFPVYTYSKNHARKMNRLISQMRGDKYHKLTKNTFRVLVVAAVLVALAVSATAYAPCRRHIVEKFKEYSTYIIGSGVKSKPVSSLTVGYIPDGYELTNEFKGKNLITLSYQNGDSFINIEKDAITSGIQFDSEKYNSREIVENNITYTIFKGSSEVTGIVWNNGEYIFVMSGTLSEAEAMKVALSIN